MNICKYCVKRGYENGWHQKLRGKGAHGTENHLQKKLHTLKKKMYKPQLSYKSDGVKQYLWVQCKDPKDGMFCTTCTLLSGEFEQLLLACSIDIMPLVIIMNICKYRVKRGHENGWHQKLQGEGAHGTENHIQKKLHTLKKKMYKPQLSYKIGWNNISGFNVKTQKMVCFALLA